jgi:hypothetical protein
MRKYIAIDLEVAGGTAGFTSLRQCVGTGLSSRCVRPKRGFPALQKLDAFAEGAEFVLGITSSASECRV